MSEISAETQQELVDAIAGRYRAGTVDEKGGSWMSSSPSLATIASTPFGCSTEAPDSRASNVAVGGACTTRP